MVDTLFLEDGDLLENVMISNQINESEIMEFYKLVSEQEMMISIYENQRFLIEQDTQIFMGLRYSNTEVLSEGVLENIGKAIMAVLKRIKELISKFIGFITGSRKKEKDVEKSFKNVEESQDKLSKEIDSTIKETKILLDDSNKTLDKYKGKLDQHKKDFEDQLEKRIKEAKNQLETYKKQIEELENAKNYIPIHINQDVMRHINISEKWTELEKVLDVFDEMVSLVKQRKDITDKYEQIKNFKPLEGNVDSHSEKGIYADGNNPCDRETYLKNYYKNAKIFFRNYTDESIENIKYVQNLQNSRIIPLEKEVYAIMKSLDKNDNYKKTVKYLHDVIHGVSSMTSIRIESLLTIERVYKSYKKNVITTAADLKKIKVINIRIKYLEKELTRLLLKKDVSTLDSDDFNRLMSDKTTKLVMSKDGTYFEQDPTLAKDIDVVLKNN